MSGEPRHGSAEREGTLILRVWLEDRGASMLRIRMIGQLDLGVAEQVTAAVATVEEAVAYVRAWLDRFAVSGEDGHPR
jgi:hypothetical protein